MLPYGTNLSTALKPSITYSGARVSPHNLALYDFSDSVVYTVTAGDGTTKIDYLVTVTVDPVAPTHGLILSKTGVAGVFTAHDFGTVEHDYSSAPAALSVTVANTGNRATDGLRVSLSGDEGSAFELSRTSLSSIAVGATATGAFTVAAKTGLTPGAYTETVTVSNTGNGIVESFELSFVVNPAPTYGIILKDGARILDDTGYDFEIVELGYSSVPEALSVTVENTGNQPTGALTAALGGTNAADFTLTPPDGAIPDIEAGGTSAFTVQPKPDLPSGSSTAALTVSGAQGGAKTFTVNFEVRDPHTQSAAAVTGGNNVSEFKAVAKDAEGNTYAVGSQTGTGTYTYGPGVSATVASDGNHAVIVKYNVSGAALWARVASGVSDDTGFYGVAVDGSGNVYTVGYQDNTETVNYGGASATGSAYINAVIVKYTSSGTALWAKSVADGQEASSFHGVAADRSGNVYAVGYQNNTETLNYGGASATGSYAPGANVVIVKYDSGSGTALWAKSVTGGGNHSSFNGVAVDGSGNVYAVGDQTNTGTFNYGGASATGSYSTNKNAVIVKYDSGSGTALWAKVADGSATSTFKGVAADGLGNVYAAGTQYNTGMFTYGTNVSVSGNKSSSINGYNAVIVKYNSAGTAQWARTAAAESPAAATFFYGVAADESGNIYAVGYQNTAGTFYYGTGVSATGSWTSQNAVIVKYNSSTGAALWAQSVTGGENASQFNGAAVDGSGNFSAVGYQTNAGAFNYGEDISAAGGSAGNNAVIVGYR